MHHTDDLGSRLCGRVDAVILDVGGTLVHEAAASTPVDDIEVRLRDSVVEDLAALRALGLPVALMTNTSMWHADDVAALLDGAGAGRFDAVVTSLDIGAAKPDPAGLIEVCRMLAMAPGRTVYVGDLDSDRLAAVAAGCGWARLDTDAPTVGDALRRWVDQTPRAWRVASGAVEVIDASAAVAAAERHLTLAKPPGSLGALEGLGARLAAIAGADVAPVPRRPAVALFAADHGVLASGVTPWPAAVTARMVEAFGRGGAAINAIAATVGATLTVVDVGVGTPLEVWDGLLRHPVRAGTRDLANGPALAAAEVEQALDVGVAVADHLVRQGHDLVVTAEMGIGNTSATSALAAVLLGVDPELLVGPGAGVPDEFVAIKRKAVAAGVARARLHADGGGVVDPLVALAEVGGLEIAALAGLCVGAAAHRIPVVLDGVITNVAALVAVRVCPEVAGYLIASHRSTEPAASPVLDEIGVVPLVDLSMRLGEGTGGALCVPLVQAAAATLAQMDTLESLGPLG